MFDPRATVSDGWEGAGRVRHSELYTHKGGAVLPRLKMTSLIFLAMVAYLVCDWLKTSVLIPTQKTMSVNEKLAVHQHYIAKECDVSTMPLVWQKH